MSRSYKWIGGIGYILTLIPYVGFVGEFLVGLAWFMAGRDTKQNIFKVAGIFMMLLTILMIAFVFYIFTFLSYLGLGGLIPMAVGRRILSIPSAQITELMEILGPVIVILAVFILVGLVAFILELISHFRAASVYGVKWFRRAGLMRIATIIIFIIILAIIFYLAITTPFYTLFFTRPEGIFSIILGYLSLIIVPAIFSIISVIFSAIAFFTIPEKIPEVFYPPPPPPP
ncbi:MAG: hypothetical protein QW655_04040 [Nitrososphaerota archaeon]|nr:hypothetical protein [Candidatus Geocrenenecus dongiae]